MKEIKSRNKTLSKNKNKKSIQMGTKIEFRRARKPKKIMMN